MRFESIQLLLDYCVKNDLCISEHKKENNECTLINKDGETKETVTFKS